MIDYHIHPGYSIDADDYSMVSYCQRALEIGLKEICFTTHFECDPLRSHLDWFARCDGKIISLMDNWMDSYFRDIYQCQKQFQPLGLKVKAGVEVGYDLGLEHSISKLVNNYPFDMVMGSVHCVDHVAISSKHESQSFLINQDMNTVVEKYFHTLLEAIRSGLFDVIGHLDLYRRHGAQYFGDSIWNCHQRYLPVIMDELVRRNMSIEINTSSQRQGQAEFFPSRSILQFAHQQGILGVTIGSDSHRVSELGSGVWEACHLASELGLSLLTYSQRKPEVIKNI